MSDEKKKKKEYEIFCEFLKACAYYQIDFNSIKVSDNPDIKCEVQDGQEKGFELAEIIHEKYQQVRNIRIFLENKLREYLLKDPKFLKDFQKKSVAIYFPENVKSYKNLQKNLKSLRELLSNMNTKGISELKPQDNLGFIDLIIIRDSNFGPSVRVPNAQSIDIPIISILQKKLQKRYLRGCDLLLYYDKLTAFDETYPYFEIDNYLNENELQNPYEIIWIFSLRNNKILFKYPS